MKTTKIKMWKQIKSEQGLMKIFWRWDDFEMIKTITLENGKEIAIVKNSEYLHKQGYAFAAVAFFTSFDYDTLIVVDNYFEIIPEYIQNFYIQHEIGHIMNGDLDKSIEELAKINKERQKGIIPQMELDADYYAAQQVGFEDAINALQYIIDNTDIFSGTRHEHKVRIKNLERLERMEDMSEEQKEIWKQKYEKRDSFSKRFAFLLMSPYVAISMTIVVILLAVTIILSKNKKKTAIYAFEKFRGHCKRLKKTIS